MYGTEVNLKKMVVILLGGYREAFIFFLIIILVLLLVFTQNVYISFGISKRKISLWTILSGQKGLDWKHI